MDKFNYEKSITETHFEKYSNYFHNSYLIGA